MIKTSTKTDKYKNACEVIVKNNLCSGCGVCSGICPEGAIKMEWNKYGELAPVEYPDRCTGCGFCLKVCPFWNQKENETSLGNREFNKQSNIKYNSVTGFYIGLFSGYSKVNEHRIKGASGGLTTWLLEKMLFSGRADYVCCVTGNKDPRRLFKYSVLDSVDDIRGASRSVYYPVEMSGIIRAILEKKGRYVIVGLPCFLKALRLAMLNNGILKERIVYLVGLVCGQQKSRFFCEYLCERAGGDSSRVTKATFRVKDPDRHHLDHRFEFSYDGIKKEGHIYQSEGMGKIWGYDYFKLNSCNFCDDITSEVADVNFGDAIEVKYSYGKSGANFIIVRSQSVLSIMTEAASKGEITLNKVPLKAILKRQKGVILLKRSDLSYRMYFLKRKKKASYFPIKRFSAGRRMNLFLNNKMRKRDRIKDISREMYSLDKRKAVKTLGSLIAAS